MNRSVKTITIVTPRRFLLLLSILIMQCLHAQQLNYSAYVGEKFRMEGPDMGQYIEVLSCHYDATNPEYFSIVGWPHSQGADVTILKYFSGEQTIKCRFQYQYEKRNGIYEVDWTDITYRIKCKPVTVTLNQSEVSLAPGETFKLSYTTNPSGMDLIVKYYSSDESIATVGETNGKITAKSGGTCVITAECNSGYANPKCTVNVEKVDPTDVSLPKNSSVKVGNSITLTPTLIPSNAKADFTWESSNTDVATVSGGKVTGNKYGTATITVKTHNGLSASCEVTVEKEDVNLTIDTESGLYEKGKVVTLTTDKNDAEIYYTLDGSTPTSGSLHYTEPITLTQSVKLKAIAMGENYNPSEILSRDFHVTSLAVKSYWPDENITNSFAIPSVSFSSSVDKSTNIDRVTLSLFGSSPISGRAIVQDGVLYFVPNETLLPGKYVLTIPQYAVINEKREPNMDIQLDMNILGSSSPILQAYARDRFTYFVDSNNTLWQCGPITATSYTNYNTIPVKVTTDVTYLSKGYYIQSSYGGTSGNLLLIKQDGSLWGCGDNSYGQLGLYIGSKYKESPIKIMDNVVCVATGGNHSLIVKQDATLWACGYNLSYGALGDGSYTNRYNPVQIMSGVSFVTAGAYYSLIIKQDGTLWACGRNSHGQLGDGTTTNRNKPVKIMSGVASVVAGFTTTLIIKQDGTLWACGQNSYGELGDGTTTDRHTPVKIMDGVSTAAAGGDHSLIIKKDGSLWACGRNRYGQLGDGTTTDRHAPVKIMDDVSTAAAGGGHSLIIKKDGTLWACGWNRYGQFGDGTRTDRITPVCIIGMPPAKVSGITLPQAKQQLTIGSEYLLLTELATSNAICSKMTFESSNPQVATVSNRGIIIAKSEGKASITVTVDDQYKETLEVTVIGKYDVDIVQSAYGSVTASPISAAAGETVTLTITPDENYMLDDLQVTDANGKAISYSQQKSKATFVMPASKVSVTATFVSSIAEVTTSAKGYVTFYDSRSAYTLPSGLKARVVTSVADSKLSYQTLTDVVPAGVAVLLCSDSKKSNSYTLRKTDNNTSYNGTNMLYGSDNATTTTGSGYHYKLSFGPSTDSELSDVFGWYWGAKNGDAFQIEGHKAWLVVPKSVGTRGYAIDDASMKINETSEKDSARESLLFDLKGRRVTTPAKGIYIKNGKKIVIR